MNSEMTGVYSGGIMYEYSVEENDFGIVTIKGDSVSKSDEYDAFKSALKANPAPTGSGGAASTSKAVSCPTSDASWNVNPSGIPSIPEQAQKYMKSGAGDGPGLGGDGSQNAADSGTSTSNVTSGEASPTSSGKGKDNAGVSMHGPVDKAPWVVSGLTICFALLGTLLL